MDVTLFEFSCFNFCRISLLFFVFFYVVADANELVACKTHTTLPEWHHVDKDLISLDAPSLCCHCVVISLHTKEKEARPVMHQCYDYGDVDRIACNAPKSR
mmetsp:Transcript_19670/g.32243  ORF Transcript_19670/g.32243 Transcript_19670/m.32243 type:complete len:101 (-) Transcript_19670:66-368(-)